MTISGPEPNLPSDSPSSWPAKPTGRSIIAGRPGGASGGPPRGSREADLLSFHAVDPRTGRELEGVYQSATTAQVAEACEAAERAFRANSARPPEDRAALLERIADVIDASAPSLLALASSETGLSVERLTPELKRTTFNLREFAKVVRAGAWLRRVVNRHRDRTDHAAHPDLASLLKPLGPVGVFGASNFPLAYSTAGTDTSSALAAGCSVVVKGHPSHPGTGEVVAQSVAAAVQELGFDPGTFSFLHSGGGGPREAAVGLELVRHPAIRAIGFTGSCSGGMALAEAARTRMVEGASSEFAGGFGVEGPVADPIPVFAEMGSTNPVFILPGALRAMGDEVADAVYSSFTNSAGQMCTCPGLIFVAAGEDATRFVSLLAQRVRASEGQVMLSFRVREGYHRRILELIHTQGVRLLARGALAQESRGGGVGEAAGQPIAGVGVGSLPDRAALDSVAMLLHTTLDVFLTKGTTRDECFGPSTLIVECPSAEDMVRAARAVQGSLAASIYARVGGAIPPEDAALVHKLVALLERRVGRLVFDGVPTGVVPLEAMVHGGPFPATNMPQATAVGARAIERWCRPVCYQDWPAELSRDILGD
ncbi:MAG: aldehyde dehydrogenase family protein [Planctomycetota bacterium]|nr:aldehyde dehydrogenase family protein [Planctomycetota bacterium]